ncbi:MAG: DUF2807 domain-containing protein [Fibrobacteres bacterium]|nr:DUF2807 domain-containing protein [Fibrobacterota bacterium]
MKTWLILATLPLLLSGCMVMDVQDAQGNGMAVTETRSLPAFDRVRLDAPVHVTVKSGDAYAAYVTTDGNLTGYLTTDSWNGTLTIGLPYTIAPTVEPQITVVVPGLRSLVHNGSGTVEIQEGGDFPDLDLTLNGSGEILFSGTATNLRATVNGAGVIDLEGFAASLTATLAGEGAIHAENLLAEDANVDLSGSGYVFLDMDYQSTLDLALTGSGRVEWWGSPAHLDYHISGEGKVVEHRGLPKRSAAGKVAAQGSGIDGAQAAAKVGAGYEEVSRRPVVVIPFKQASAK